MRENELETWYQAGGLSEPLFEPGPSLEADDLSIALSRGDREAVRLVYRQHHEVVRAFARRLLGSESDAEELLQETFLSLPRAMRRFRGDSTLRTFLLSIAAQLARNFLRARRRRYAAESRLAQELAVAPPDAAQAPDAALAQQSLAERLQRAMESLSEDQRIAFVLAEVEERSSAEVARILDVPASTVRSRVAAAKERLRQWFTEGERS